MCKHNPKIMGNIHSGSLPGFLIIGAQKSGTSSLSYYLKQHPELGVANEKEIHYFDTKIHQGYSIDWYKRLFKNNQKNPKLYFESTPRYLCQYDVPQNVHRYMPHAKFIVILRNPIDRAWSHYNMQIRLGYVNHPFHTTIKQNIRRIEKETFPSLNNEKYPSIWNSIVARGIYSYQLKNWFNYFDQTQFLILGFQDLTTNLRHTLSKVYDFLEIRNIDLKNINTTAIGIGYYPSPLKNDDKESLDKFYDPYNKDLYNLLGYQVNW